MMDYEKFRIPQTLNDPEKILFFTINEIMLFLVFPLLVGLTFNCQTKCFLFGISSFLIYKKFKPTHDNSVYHILYWYLPSWLFKTDFISSSIRIFY